MELQDTAASRVSIGFPLGLALLFVCLLFICGFFCCCLHWNRLRSLLQSHGIINTQSLEQTQIQAELASGYQKPAFPVVVRITSHPNSQKSMLYINTSSKKKKILIMTKLDGQL